MVKRTKKMNFSKPILLLLFLALLVVVIVLIVKNNKNETFQGQPEIYIPPEVANPDKVRELLSIPERVYAGPCNDPDRYCVIYEEFVNVTTDLWNIIVSKYGEPDLGTWPNPTNWPADDELVILLKILEEKFGNWSRMATERCKDGLPRDSRGYPSDRPPAEVFGCPYVSEDLLQRIRTLKEETLESQCSNPDRYCVILKEYSDVMTELSNMIEPHYGDNPQNWPNVQAVNLSYQLFNKFDNWSRMATERCVDGLPRDSRGYPSDRPPAEVFGCRPDSRFEPPDVPRPTTTPTEQAQQPITTNPIQRYRPCINKRTCQNSSYIKLYAPRGRSQLRTAEFKDSNLLGVKFTNIYSIPDACFYRCRELNTLDLTRIRNIGNVAFRDTYNLTEITIPFTVRDIGVQAFYTFGYRGLVKITFQRATRSLLNMIRKRTVVFGSNTINPNWANNSRLVIEFNQSTGRWVKVN